MNCMLKLFCKVDQFGIAIETPNNLAVMHKIPNVTLKKTILRIYYMSTNLFPHDKGFRLLFCSNYDTSNACSALSSLNNSHKTVN